MYLSFAPTPGFSGDAFSSSWMFAIALLAAKATNKDRNNFFMSTSFYWFTTFTKDNDENDNPTCRQPLVSPRKPQLVRLGGNFLLAQEKPPTNANYSTRCAIM